MHRHPLLVAASLLVTSCSLFGSKSRLLAPVSGREQEALQSLMKGQPGPVMCGLSTSDGLVRIMATGNKAVVDVGGRPHFLAMTVDEGSAGRAYAADGITIDLSFVENLLSKGGSVVGHKAGVMVRTPTGTEHFYGLWDC